MPAALIPLLIQLMPLIISAGEAGVRLIEGLRTTAQQSDVWTPEAEAAYQSQLVNANSLPESQTDAEAKR